MLFIFLKITIFEVFRNVFLVILLKLHGLIYFRYYWISNNFPCKKIILESYKLSSIYTSRIILLLELEMSKINESNFFMGTQKTNQIHDGNVKKKIRLISLPKFLSLFNRHVMHHCKQNRIQEKQWKKCTHVSFFLVWQNILTFIKAMSKS